ncbi:MAG: SAM-dependent methyltransferase [Acidobacteriota bacterium]
MRVSPLEKSTELRLGASFRDPSGHLFRDGDRLFRQVNDCFRDSYDLLIGSGLYRKLSQDGRLIPHEEVEHPGTRVEGVYRILEPEKLPFISYPYEWCFGQLKDAALLTLEIQQAALAHGLTLRDASAFNVQFRGSVPVFIDTLSFGPYNEGEPWVAYRQFCQHFLAPLALASRCDVRLCALLQRHLDGVPLDLASRLLPARTRLNLGFLTHLHLHARSQRRWEGKQIEKPRPVSRRGLLGILSHLERTVQKLHWKPSSTVWTRYDNQTSYSQQAAQEKRGIVSRFVERVEPRMVWDLGANRGDFARLAAARGAVAVGFESDPAVVEATYQTSKERGDNTFLSLCMDLSNPSPALGWMHRERDSLTQRGPADLLLALALVHHLAIGNNVPLPQVAEMLAGLGESLVIEFVPKEDQQVQRMLASREDIFSDYSVECFEQAFRAYFDVLEKERIPDSVRTLYLMKRKQVPIRTSATT